MVTSKIVNARLRSLTGSIGMSVRDLSMRVRFVLLCYISAPVFLLLFALALYLEIQVAN